MSTISPAAAAARESARTPTGQFGEQNHDSPSGSLAESVYLEPDNVALDGGGSIWLPEWATADGRAPKWPDALHTEGDVEIAVDREDEPTTVDLYWTAPDGSEHAVWFSRPQGPYACVATSFEAGENEELVESMDEKTREQLEDYGCAVLRRAEDVADNLEFNALNGDARRTALWKRLSTPQPFTQDELDENSARLRMNDLCEQTGYPAVASLIEAGRERGDITDEQIKRMSYEDIERFGQIWSETVTRIADLAPQEGEA